MKSFAIAGSPIGPGHPCFIIAEAGVNHNGDPAMALKLVDVAAEMGADAVIIGFQGERRVGAFVSGFPGDAEIQPEIGRVVQATAIAFRR